MIRNAERLLEEIRTIHAAIRDQVVAATEHAAVEQLAAGVAEEEGGDTIFAIDRISEAVLLERFAVLAQEWPCVLIAEGLGTTGEMVLPRGMDRAQAEIIIIVDPIDGTRGLMYQKRSAWVLTGVAPNRGGATSLADIALAVQTEIPLLKQHLCDSLWTGAGQQVGGERLNRLTGERMPLMPHPTRATSIAQGYGAVARFFPGGRSALAALDDALIERLLGPNLPGRAQAFEDQYVSSGGQLYELMMGHDRWVADLRPLLEPLLQARGQVLGLTCHPYDLCTELIARAAGVIVTDAHGEPLRAPLNVGAAIAWIGYGNAALRRQIEPVLLALIREHLGS
jgi:fructose-1,6-bisphosphatase/inositol monophosphatase family enzyme